MNWLIGHNSRSSPLFWFSFFLSLTLSLALIFKVTSSHSSVDEPLWLLDPPESFDLTDLDSKLAQEEERADLAQETF